MELHCAHHGIRAWAQRLYGRSRLRASRPPPGQALYRNGDSHCTDCGLGRYCATTRHRQGHFSAMVGTVSIAPVKSGPAAGDQCQPDTERGQGDSGAITTSSTAGARWLLSATRCQRSRTTSALLRVGRNTNNDVESIFAWGSR